MKKYLAILFVGLAAICNAQDYDADSLLYTPLSKGGAKKIKLVDAEKNAKRIGYFFNVQMGSLIGCNNCGQGKDVTFSAATTHGVTIGKKLRGGLGVGFDSYANWQTLPVFASVSFDLIGNKDKSAVFIQLSEGWAHPWFVRSNLYNNYTTDPFNAVSGGRMTEPSIGYRLKYHDLKLSFSVGYKYQRIFYRTQPTYTCAWCEFYHVPYENLDVTQEISRLHLMMIVGWK